jgi:hypothetical protein
MQSRTPLRGKSSQVPLTISATRAVTAGERPGQPLFYLVNGRLFASLWRSAGLPAAGGQTPICGRFPAVTPAGSASVPLHTR